MEKQLLKATKKVLLEESEYEIDSLIDKLLRENHKLKEENKALKIDSLYTQRINENDYNNSDELG